jgi:hypothetical protein
VLIHHLRNKARKATVWNVLPAAETVAAMKPYNEVPLNLYEKKRAERIARNQKLLGEQHRITTGHLRCSNFLFTSEIRLDLHGTCSILEHHYLDIGSHRLAWEEILTDVVRE